MSDCMIVRKGGSANIDPSGAVLICETKADNTASITKGSKTILLTPDKAFYGDDAGKAEYIFPISKSNLGTWTLEVSKDEETNSKEVTVAAGQFLVEKLNINTGVILSPETGLADGITISSGAYDEITKKITLQYSEDSRFTAKISGFDPDDFSKATITIENVTAIEGLTIALCVIKKGTRTWGRKTINSDIINQIVVDKDSGYTSGDGESDLALGVYGFPNHLPSITSIIFE